MANKQRPVNQNNPLVFVYGTLKKGWGNHERLMGNAEFLHRVRLPKSYHMLDMGGFPGIVFSSACRSTHLPEASPVYGELYRVPKYVLDHLDLLEGHPSFYQRFSIDLPVEKGDDPVMEKGYYYVLPANHVEAPNGVLHSSTLSNLVPTGAWRPTDEEKQFIKHMEQRNNES